MTDPVVSVIMPAFNAEQYLQESVESVRLQSLTSWELLIVDDGSTDNTAAMAKQLAASDERISVLSMESPSGGAATPRNAAIAQAQGRFVAFLDADDIWLPEKLERQTGFMIKNHAAIACTAYYTFTESDGRGGALIPPPRAGYSSLLKANTAGCLTVMIDRDRVNTIEFPVCGHEDYALWLSLLRQGHTMYGMPQVLAGYRLSRNSLSGNKWKNLLYFWHIYRFREHFGPLQSLFMCVRYARGAYRKYVA